MKVSLITVTYNSEMYLEDCINSVSSQDYPDIEHIIIDGGSVDGTLEIIKKYSNQIAKYISEKDKGIYDAMNKGIMMATGDIVGILNSDDFFPNSNIISTITDVFRNNNVDAIYGDIAFVKPENLQKVIRHYSGIKFKPSRFAYGYMPPHPSFYVKRDCYTKLGFYKLDYKIAADYELLIRFIYKHKISCKYINNILVYMRTGGVSNKNFFSRYTLNKEIIKACKENQINTNMAILSLKYINKIFEYIKPAFRQIGK